VAEFAALYASFIHQRTGSKKIKKQKHRKQPQINLTDMQLYANFTARPGLKVIKKCDIDSITVLILAPWLRRERERVREYRR